ncbi:MAG: leucyl aminopeptidase [Oceanicaulis sp.]|uniref:leucyl aminopeptidase n=1 Tax=unclassified Oceanicaulis TaxID=2632123 RepID=UPI0000669A20|nr:MULTISPECIES: leucyl aminopeptidase [unclassified Oceanicaulis]EAP89323.1 leucyl aminopeptidase [Oceanicaulis sp. HTCC2633]MBC38312.1 leucyl aminopeptidase [Oceanicaulis sp.]MBG36427.1 leucyl aminopeptidase [Oceanicaulis sp.]HBU61396.1 leucyl aminopeptidase [Oceanicaulis sp.]
MKISFAASASGDAIAAPVFADRALSDAAKALDSATSGAVTRAIEASRFKGGAGDLLEITAPAGVDATRIVLFGLGDKAKLDGNGAEKAVAGVIKSILISGAKSVSVHLDGDAELLCRGALGASLAAYRFDTYRTKLSDDKKPSVQSVEIVSSDAAAAEKLWADWAPVAEGVTLARNLVNETPNVLYPESYAEKVKELSKLGLEVEVLGEAEMEKLGMHALLGVGQGSVRESKMVVIKWNGGKSGDKPLAFIGKGVTFDSGGISLKPGQGMDEMKGDMGGSAAVVGLMAALAGRKAKANVIGVIGLVENMPDGNAQRPGDIVKSMSGQTIEIHNTDAEGRLVLGDVLWYTQDRFDPKFMINLATLTGAILIALGHEHAGVFSNDDDLVGKLEKAGKASDETVWRLPIGPEYDRQIDTPNADMKNVGEGRLAGSITAAQFLKRHVNEKPWIHIDIAGTGMNAGSKDPRIPTFGTGYGVRLLDRLVRDNFEG